MSELVNAIQAVTPLLARRGGTFRGTCPFCCRVGTLRVDPVKAWWKCLGCQSSGDLARFQTRTAFMNMDAGEAETPAASPKPAGSRRRRTSRGE